MYKQIQEIVDRFNGKHFNGVYLELTNNTQTPEQIIKDAIYEGETEEQAQKYINGLGYLSVYVSYPMIEYSEYCDVEFNHSRLEADLTEEFKKYVPEGTKFTIRFDKEIEFTGPDYS